MRNINLNMDGAVRLIISILPLSQYYPDGRKSIYLQMMAESRFLLVLSKECQRVFTFPYTALISEINMSRLSVNLPL